MTKSMFLFAISFLILSCGSETSKKESNTISEQQASTINDQSKIGKSNYAVIWKWATTNAQLVSDNSPTISKELMDLWKEGVVENAYYDADSPTDKLANFPNIAFFLKANSEADVKSILDKLTVVQKGIATYQIHPVGLLWLDRKTDVINEKGITKSFATVWTTTGSLDKPDADKLLQLQNDMIVGLWKNGVVENVYFDVEHAYKVNDKTDFVFFINAKTEVEARAICNSLPFYKEKIASYELHQAGVFWMGKYGDD